jgi:hypothetical protein
MKARLLERSGEPGKARETYERVLEQREYQWARAGLAKIDIHQAHYFGTAVAETPYGFCHGIPIICRVRKWLAS